MAISTIGNITYINQNMQTTSAAYANAAQRGDIIPQEFEDKLKEIQEVRPTETDMKINKDSKNKHNQEKEEQKQAGSKENTEENDEKTIPKSSGDGHLLNIKV